MFHPQGEVGRLEFDNDQPLEALPADKRDEIRSLLGLLGPVWCEAPNAQFLSQTREHRPQGLVCRQKLAVPSVDDPRRFLEQVLYALLVLSVFEVGCVDDLPEGLKSGQRSRLGSAQSLVISATTLSRSGLSSAARAARAARISPWPSPLSTWENCIL